VIRVFKEDAGHVTQEVVDSSVGEIEARRVIDGIRDGVLTEDVTWFRFLDLAQRAGSLRSGLCKSFVIALAKRAAGA